MPPLSRGLCRRLLTSSAVLGPQKRALTSGRDRFFRVSEEVQDALKTGKPVVALETTIYTHGKDTEPAGLFGS
jgi:Indigoidine synthase A like protein